MSVNYNRASVKHCKTHKEYKRKQIKWMYPIYWDEGKTFYPQRNRGTHHIYPKLYSYQIRMYKTWKHSRKTQWKE